MTKLMKILDKWAEEYGDRITADVLDENAILFLDELHGSKKFDYVLEFIGNLKVSLAVRLLPELKGSSNCVSKARGYLSQLNNELAINFAEAELDNHDEVLKPDVMGNISARVIVECEPNLRDMEQQLQAKIILLTTTLNDIHERIILKIYREYKLTKNND